MYNNSQIKKEIEDLVEDVEKQMDNTISTETERNEPVLPAEVLLAFSHIEDALTQIKRRTDQLDSESLMFMRMLNRIMGIVLIILLLAVYKLFF